MAAEMGTEARIHGIGNHEALSALGAPILHDGTFLDSKSKEPAVVQPLGTGHAVWLVAWTRSSRALNSLAWYLGLPFTLCNTAGHMRSPGWFGRVTAAVTVLVGCLLTLGAFLWSVVIVENIYYGMHAPASVLGLDVPLASLIGVTLIWVVLLGMRVFSQKYDDEELVPMGRVLAVVHCLVLVVAAWLIWNKKPATAPDECWSFDDQPCLSEVSDWATTVGWATIVLTGVIILVFATLTLIGHGTNWRGGSTFPHLGTAITLGVAALLSHLANSGIVLLVDLVTQYANSMNPWAPDHPGAIPLLRQFDYGALIYRGSDTLAASWAPIGLVVVAIAIALRLSRRLYDPTGEDQARVVHKVITRPGAVLYPLSVIAVVVLVTAALAWTLVHMDSVQAAGLTPEGPEGLDEAVRFITVVGTHALMVFLPFALLSRDVRATVAVISDVVGYWSVAYHPLAAPPYRFDVIKTADDIAKLDKPVVIVGHSQGSVLAVGIVERLAQKEGYDKSQYFLVTCGSPLASLYSTYFPRAFPDTVRRDTAGRVAEWRNLWRTTDPISTELGLGTPDDMETKDGSEREDDPTVLRIHSDYWIETDQINAVGGLLPPATTADAKIRQE